MTVSANAKINYTLEVYGKRPDGYHALRSLVVPISLADTLEIEPTDDGTITSDTGYDDDLCVKAAKALKIARLFDCSDCSIVRLKGARISVKKLIPVGGGLGGGSADAAATLRTLNELWGFGKTPEELAEIGAAVGSDVPALVLAQHYRRPVLMEGRGEKVSLSVLSIEQSNNPNNRTIPLVLANPGVSVSTAEIYGLCVPRTAAATEPVNDLQEPAIRRHPEIAAALAALKAAGATNVRMSGSGATSFGFAANADDAARIVRQVASAGFDVWSTEVLSN